MSSATSTDTLRQNGAVPAAGSGSHDASALRPWHFFVVCAMLGATLAVLTTSDNRPVNLAFLSLAILSAGVVGLAVHRTIRPLVGADSERAMAPAGARARVALEREKMLVLRSIKELEFDRAMGKVAEPDFHEMVARLRARAIGLMRQLDERQPGYRDLIEREVQRRLAARHGVAAGAGRPEVAAGEPAVACSQCRTSNDPDAKFCKGCGTRLTH